MQLYVKHHSGKCQNLEFLQSIFWEVGVRLLVVGQWPACLGHLPLHMIFPMIICVELRIWHCGEGGRVFCHSVLPLFFFLLTSSTSFLSIPCFREIRKSCKIKFQSHRWRRVKSLPHSV